MVVATEVVGGELQEGDMVVTGQNVSSAARTQSTRRQRQVLVVVHRVWVAPVEEEGNPPGSGDVAALVGGV